MGGLTPGQFGRARLSPETTTRYAVHVLRCLRLQPADRVPESEPVGGHRRRGRLHPSIDFGHRSGSYNISVPHGTGFYQGF